MMLYCYKAVFLKLGYVSDCLWSSYHQYLRISKNGVHALAIFKNPTGNSNVLPRFKIATSKNH